MTLRVRKKLQVPQIFYKNNVQKYVFYLDNFIKYILAIIFLFTLFHSFFLF